MADIKQQVWEIFDRYGNRIFLTAERWQHVLHRRPWLESHFDDILETLRKGRRKQDPMDQAKYKYYYPCSTLAPDNSHLVAVVKFDKIRDVQGSLSDNNFVMTAWAVFLYGRS